MLENIYNLHRVHQAHTYRRDTRTQATTEEYHLKYSILIICNALTTTLNKIIIITESDLCVFFLLIENIFGKASGDSCRSTSFKLLKAWKL